MRLEELEYAEIADNDEPHHCHHHHQAPPSNIFIGCLLRICSKATIRRLVRLFYLFAILFCYLGIPIILYNKMISNKRATVSSKNPLNLELEHCKLYFKEDEDLGIEDVAVQLSVAGDSGIWEDEVTRIVAKNSKSSVDGCWVSVSSQSGTIYKEIDIKCKKDCIILHEGPEMLNVEGRFSYVGEKTALNMMGITAESLSIRTESGQVSIHEGNLRKWGEISNPEGDVIFQSSEGFDLNYTMDSSQICSGAPRIVTKEDVSPECKHLFSKVSAFPRGRVNLDTPTYQNLLCQGVYQLASHSSQTLFPIISVFVHSGNLYANVINASKGSVLHNYDMVYGEEYTKGISFEKKYEARIVEEKKYYNNTDKTDSMMMFNLGNYLGRASSTMRMIASTNPGYIHAKPWWLSLFSASLLIGGFYDMSGRLRPGLCPYYPVPNAQDVGSVHELILSKLAENTIESNDMCVLSYTEKLPEIKKYDHSESYGTMSSAKKVQFLHPILNSKSEYVLQEENWQEHADLYAAIIISLTLSSIIGIFFIFVLAYGLQMLFDYFADESKHIQKYTKLITEPDHHSAENIEPTINPAKNKLSKHQHTHSTGSSRSLVLEPEGDEDNWLLPPLDTGKPVSHTKKRGFFSTIFGRLPSQFIIIDHCVFLVKRYFTHSVQEFYDIMFTSISQDSVEDHMEDISLTSLKARYEKFCFLKQYTEENMFDELSIEFLQHKGYTLKKRKDIFTEVFKKIRFKNEKEKGNIGSGGTEMDENSLKRFIHNECTITQFDEDQITFEELRHRYLKYCLQYRLQLTSICRSSMSHYFGIEAEKKELTFICRREDMSDDLNFHNVYYKIDLEHCDNYLSELMGLHSETNSHHHTKHKKGDPWTRYWFVMDFAATMIHIGNIFFLMFIPMVLPCLLLLERSKFGTADYNSEFRWEDITSHPWNIPHKVFKQDLTFAIFWGFAVFYGILSFIDLLFYYATVKLPMNTLSAFQRKDHGGHVHKGTKKVLKCIKKGSLFVEWVCIFLIIGLLTGFVFLICIWSILGAVMNPNAYLMYAATASTFMTFISVKIQQFNNLRAVGLAAIRRLVMEQLEGFMSGVMKKMAVGMGVKQEVLQGVIETVQDPSHLQSQLASYVASSPMAKMLGGDLDPALLVRVAQGDVEAIVLLGKSKGVPRSIMLTIIAVMKKDPQLLEEGLQDILSHPTISIPPLLTHLLIEMFFNPHSKQKNIINQLSIAVFTLIEENTSEGKELIGLIKPVFPEIIHAILELNKGSIDSFIDSLSALNSSLIEAAKKKTSFKQSFGMGDTPLFRENGEPTFAIPSYMITLMDIMKIFLAFNNIEEISLNRLFPKIFKLVEDVLGVDRDLLDFLALIFSESNLKAHGSSSTKSIMTREQKNILIENLASKMKIPPGIIRIFMRLALHDNVVDRELINDLISLFSSCPYYKEKNLIIDPELLRTGLNLSGILKNISVKQSLIDSANMFLIEPADAQALVNLSSKYEFTKDSMEQLEEASITFFLSRMLKLRKQEVLGLIGLFMGDLDTENTELLMKTICMRSKLRESSIPILKSLLTLFMGKKTEDIIYATETLQIEDYIWVLLGKKLISPRFIDAKAFYNLGIPQNNPIIEARKDIECQDEITFNLFLKRLEELLSTSTEESFTMGEEEDKWYQVPKKEDQGKDRGRFKRQRSKGASIVINQDSPKVAELLERRKLIVGLMRLNEQSLNPQLIELLLTNYYKHQEQIGNLNKYTQEQIERIVNFLCVKDIILNKGGNQIATACQRISEIMGFNERIVINLVKIIVSKNSQQVRVALKSLFRGNEGGHFDLGEFGRVVVEGMEGVRGMEDAMKYISSALNTPLFILNKILAPFIGETYSLSMNDVCKLMHMGGFNHENFLNRGITIIGTQGNLIPPKKFILIIAGLAVGHITDYNKTLQIFNIPLHLQHFIKAITSNRPRIIIEILIRHIQPMLLAKLSIPSYIFDIFIAILVFFKGFGKDFRFNFKGENLTSINYLGKQLGMIPEVLLGIEAIITNNKHKVANILFNLATHGKSIGKPIIEPQLVKGIIALVSGEPHSTEDLAEALNIGQDLIDVCLLFSNFTKRVKPIPQLLAELSTDESFRRFCLGLKMNSDQVNVIFQLAFNTVDYQRIVQAFNTLKMNEFCDIPFILALMSISRGYNAKKYFEENDVAKGSLIRSQICQEIQQYATPLFKMMHIDPEFGLITIRMQQGDFYIIEDKVNFFLPFLPTLEIQNIAMGLCGMLTCQIKFRNVKITDNDRQYNKYANFEGATELLDHAVGITPLVARLVTFDTETYENIEREYGFPTIALKAIIISLVNLPPSMLNYLIFRDLLKLGENRKYHLLDLKNVLEEMQPDLDEVKKAKYSTYDDFFDQIDFSDPKYLNLEDEYEADNISMDPLTEMLEVYLFNKYNWMGYNYKDIRSERKRKKNFHVDDMLAEYILGSKSEYEQSLAKAFFEDPNKPILWANARHDFQGGTFSWCEKENRSFAKNIWAEFKLLLKDISKDLHLERRITISQIISYSEVIAMRLRVNDPAWDPESNEQYGGFMDSLNNVLDGLEVNSFFALEESSSSICGLGKKYNKFWLMKIVGLSLGIRISNAAEEHIKSLYCKEIYEEYPVKANESIESLERAVEYIEDLDRRLKRLDMYYTYYSWGEVKEEFEETQEAMYPSYCCNPYNIEGVREFWVKNEAFFPYEPRPSPFIISTDQLSLDLKAKMFRRPRILVQDEDEEEVEEDMVILEVDLGDSYVDVGDLNEAKSSIQLSERIAYASVHSSPVYSTPALNLTVPKSNLGDSKHPKYKGHDQGNDILSNDFGRVEELQNIKEPSQENRLKIFHETGLSYMRISDTFKLFERHVIVDFEAFNFIIKIAKNDCTAFEDIKNSLIKAGLIKAKDEEQSILFYKSALHLLNMSKSMKDYLNDHVWIGDSTSEELPDIKPFLNIVSNKITIDSPILENLIMVAHGNIESVNLQNIANRFQLPPNLIDAFFLSAQPSLIKENQAEVLRIISPLVQRRGFNVPEIIIYAFTNIYAGSYEGWLILAKFLGLHATSFLNISQFINLINWYDIKNIQKMPGTQPKTAVKSDYLESIINLLQHIYHQESVENLEEIKGKTTAEKTAKIIELSNKNLRDEPKLLNVFKLVDGIMNKDIDLIFTEINNIKELLEIKDEKTEPIFRAFTLLLNNTHMNMDRDTILEYIEVLFTAIFEMMHFNNEEDKATYEKVLNGIIEAIFAIIYSDKELFLSALSKINEFFERMMALLNNLHLDILPYLNNIGYKLYRAKDSPAESVLRAIVIIVKLIMDKSEEVMEFQSKKRKRIKAQTAEEMRNPININLSSEGQIKILDSFSELFDLLPAEKVENSTIIEFAGDVVADVNAPEYYNSLEEFVDNTHILNLENKNFLLNMIVLMTIGDYKYCMELLLKQFPNKLETTQKIITAFISINNILDIKKKDFKNCIIDESYLNYGKELDNITELVFVTMNTIVKSKLLRKRGERKSVHQKKLQNTCEFFRNNKDFLKNVIKLLHSIKFGAVINDYMLGVIVNIIIGVAGVDKEAYEKFLDLLTGALGFDIRTPDQEEQLPMSRRVYMVLEGMGNFFFPQLVKPDSILIVLLDVAMAMEKASTNQMNVKTIAKQYGCYIGTLFGIDPKIINTIMAVLNGDFATLARLAAPIVLIEPATMELITQIMSTANSIIGYKTHSASTGPAIPQYKKEAWIDLLKKVNSGNASIRELFELADAEGDNSGGINKEEFKTLTQHLNINMSDHRINEIWSKIKKRSSKHQEDLDIKEFELAMFYLQSRTTGSALEMLGLSTNRLIILLVGLVLLLGLIFLFVLMGVKAFTVGGTFNSIVNSILPCVAGGVVGQKKPVDTKSTDWGKKVEGVVEKVTEIILSGEQ